MPKNGGPVIEGLIGLPSSEAVFPNTAVARVNLLDTGTIGENATAVQVSDYVYVTAAHVFFNTDGMLFPGTKRIYPADRIPYARCGSSETSFGESGRAGEAQRHGCRPPRPLQ